MVQSMTAFARSQAQVNGLELVWELRSVNHRYLDVSFRLPESFRYLEPELRTLLRDKLSRGKLECQLKYQNTSSDNQAMLINKGIVNALLQASAELLESQPLENDLSVSKVLAWPGVLQVQEADMDALGKQVLSSFEKALLQAVQVRASEGLALKKVIDDRLQSLVQEVSKAKTLVAKLQAQIKAKLQERIKMLELELAEQRLDQEIALILTRMDVTEELDRLETHCQEVNRCLAHDKVAGRRLDFLMQELNREANTLSSKSDSVELTQSAVEMKVLIEQMREQIQNIE